MIEHAAALGPDQPCVWKWLSGSAAVDYWHLVIRVPCEHSKVLMYARICTSEPVRAEPDLKLHTPKMTLDASMI